MIGAIPWLTGPTICTTLAGAGLAIIGFEICVLPEGVKEEKREASLLNDRKRRCSVLRPLASTCCTGGADWSAAARGSRKFTRNLDLIS